MDGCRRVRKRRLVRVLGTVAAATAAFACLSARIAPPVLGVQASVEAPDKPHPTATPVPTATPTPASRPTPTLTPMPTPMPTLPPEASPRPSEHPAPAPHRTPAPEVVPPSAAPTPPPAAPTAVPRPRHELPTPHATPSLVTELSALPTAVAEYAQDSHGHTSPYVVGADAMAGVAVASCLALDTLRRRGLL